jgi:hypothetical protein
MGFDSSSSEREVAAFLDHLAREPAMPIAAIAVADRPDSPFEPERGTDSASPAAQARR